jgi:hypothetical protein
LDGPGRLSAPGHRPSILELRLELQPSERIKGRLRHVDGDVVFDGWSELAAAVDARRVQSSDADS